METRVEPAGTGTRKAAEAKGRPRTSCLINCYDYADYVVDAARSALEQTVPFEDAEEVTLVIYAPRRVWMRPVDGAGDPIDAVLRPGVAQPDGTWLLERRAPEATVRALTDGRSVNMFQFSVHDAATLRAVMRNIAKIQGVYDVERV